jgi:hypothetical protein
VYTHGNGWVRIEDDREAAWMGSDTHHTIVLQAVDAAIYRALDRVRTIPDVAAEVGASPAEVRSALERLERARLVLCDGPRWLALAIQTPRAAHPRSVGRVRPPRWDRPAPAGLPWPEACPEDALAAINAACAST